MTRPALVYPAREARLAAGIPLAVAARRLRVQPSTLAAYERLGRFSEYQARVLARMYGCSMWVFLQMPRRGERLDAVGKR